MQHNQTVKVFSDSPIHGTWFLCDPKAKIMMFLEL